MSNEVMTRNSEWMNHIVNHLNRMVEIYELYVFNIFQSISYCYIW